MILKDQDTRNIQHGLLVYLTQYTLRMITARVKQEEERDTRIMQESSKKSVRKERGHEEE